MAITAVQAWASTTTGTGTGSVSVSWGASRTLGNLILLGVNSDTTESTPSGWTLDQSQVNDSGLYLFFRIADDTATDAPTFSSAFVKCLAWAEYRGHRALTPSDVSASNGTSTYATNTTFGTGTTGSIAQAFELAVALWGYSSSTGATPIPGDMTGGNHWGSYTNSFTEQLDVGTTRAGNVTNVGLAVATLDVTTTGTKTCTATRSGSSAATALIGTYRAAGAQPLPRRPRRWFRTMGGLLLPTVMGIVAGAVT